MGKLPERRREDPAGCYRGARVAQIDGAREKRSDDQVGQQGGTFGAEPAVGSASAFVPVRQSR